MWGYLPSLIHTSDSWIQSGEKRQDREDQSDNAENLCRGIPGDDDTDEKNDKNQLGSGYPIDKICDKSMDFRVGFRLLIGIEKSNAISSFGPWSQVEHKNV